MALWFVLFAIIGTHFFLDDLAVTAATSERTHTGSPVFIVLDIFALLSALPESRCSRPYFWRANQIVWSARLLGVASLDLHTKVQFDEGLQFDRQKRRCCRSRSIEIPD
jgi:hypothetical protein